MLMSSGLATAANIGPTPNLPRLPSAGLPGSWKAARFFHGAQAKTTSGTLRASLGGWAQGLSLSAFDQATVIHEFMHQLGIAGADTSGQTYTLPNGDTVTGSNGISQEVRDKCLK